MQTIKGLIALLLVGAAVFTAVTIYNSRTEPKYEAGMKQATLADTVKTAKQTMTAATKAGMVKTNGVARQKIKNVNL
ncbi:MAG TPA: hypothetical protein VIK35_09940 [Verrucomicrobiae bacterium]